MGAAAMAASLAVGASVVGRPAAVSATDPTMPVDLPAPAVLSMERTARTVDSSPSLHGLPPEVFAARVGALADLLASR